MECRYASLDADVDHLLQLSCVLDPRFKLSYVKDRAKVLEDMEKQMFECYSSEHTTTVSTDDNTSTDQPPAKKPKGLSKILGQCQGHSSAAPSTPQEKVKQQLDQYLSHPHLDVEECPLKWWKNESSHYPVVAQLARKYLSVCATSVLAG